MNFNSLQFLLFLAVVLLLYWILPHKFRWVLLLLASYYFYMSWNAWLIFLILATTAVSYAAAILIHRTQSKGRKKAWLAVTLVVCLGALAFFKYFNFLCESVVGLLNLFSLQIDGFALDILLPVGISFYTFQTLSYVIDVYRGRIAPERHFGYYALFVCYFPQLVAGPIERPENLLPQLRAEHKLNADDLSAGLRVALCGFFRKCVVADFCGIYVNNVFNDLGNANSLAVYLAGVLFAVQMYCDFAGYSEIAAGCARMMGVKLMRNFDRPYLSQSYTEFFRRWHISLNQWFTDYVYIPLGGNRKGVWRKILNTFIVFVLCGLWHGASWTYVVWGLNAAFFVCIESLLRKPFARFVKKHNVDLGNAAVKLARRSFLFFVLFIHAALIFRAQSVAEMGAVFSRLFTATGFGADYIAQTAEVTGLTVAGAFQLLLSVVCMCLLYRYGEYEGGREPCTLTKTQSLTLYAQRVSVTVYAVAVIAVFWIALVGADGVSSFAYFQF